MRLSGCRRGSRVLGWSMVLRWWLVLLCAMCYGDRHGHGHGNVIQVCSCFYWLYMWFYGDLMVMVCMLVILWLWSWWFDVHSRLYFRSALLGFVIGGCFWFFVSGLYFVCVYLAWTCASISISIVLLFQFIQFHFYFYIYSILFLFWFYFYLSSHLLQFYIDFHSYFDSTSILTSTSILRPTPLQIHVSITSIYPHMYMLELYGVLAPSWHRL